MERQHFKPLRAGRCDWCGGEIDRGQRFCPGVRCGALYRDMAKARGAQLYDTLVRWRLWRRKAGATAGLLSVLAQRLDEFIDVDRRARALLEDDDA